VEGRTIPSRRSYRPQQCFIVSKPLAARRIGVAVKVFPVSNIGYNPYTTVLAASGETLKKNADMPARSQAHQ
jgi:hypothetical protein